MPLLADEVTSISDIKGCRAIKNETERLACYDTVSDGGVFDQQKRKQVQVEEFETKKKSVKESEQIGELEVLGPGMLAWVGGARHACMG